MGWNVWFYWDFLKGKMTKSGETHLSRNPNQKNQVYFIIDFRNLDKQ